MKLLSKKAIDGLKAHKYKAGSYTPFDAIVYKHFWNPILEIVPLWMAPNLITFTGFLAAFLNLIPLLLLNPTLSGGVSPGWLFLACSLGFFFYTTMDAIDGGQARRTKSSSPLGQLFDHGCDGILSGVLPIFQMHAFGIGITPKLPILIGVTQTLFFLGMWEEKYTGVCRTTILGVIGTTEFMLFFVVHQFIAGFFAVDFSSSLLLVTIVGAVVSLMTTIVNTVSKCPLSATRELVAITFFNLIFSCANYSTVSPYLVQSFTNGFLITRMIFSSMSKTEFQSMQWIVVVPIVCIFWMSEIAMNAWLVMLSAFLIFYLTKICLEISQSMAICVFKISPKLLTQSST